MAERGSQDIYSSGGMGRERVLTEAIEDFRRRERGQRSPSPPPMVQRGRAGAPGMIRRIVERCPGAVTTFNLRGRTRGRDFPSYSLPCQGGGFPSHSPPHQGRSFRSPSPPHPGGRGRARALPLSTQAPLPTPGPTRMPRFRNVQAGPQ